jgi:hypothetical protein
MDAKGRLGLSQGVREEADLPADVELVVRVEGPGRVLLLTRQAIEDELHELFSDGPPVEEFLRWKAEDAEVEEERRRALLTDRHPKQEAS